MGQDTGGHMKNKIVLIFSIAALILSACLCSSLPIPSFTPTSTPISTATPPVTDTPTALPPTGINSEQGSYGLGDPFYPLLGNGGYDVQHYEISLNVHMTDGTVNGSTVIEVRATENLSAFDLDFSGMNILLIQVDYVEAQYSRSGTELTITPVTGLTNGDLFTVRVDYEGKPEQVSDPSLSVREGIGWLNFTSGVYTINEPSGSMDWFPSNNYPADKATYTFYVTVEKPYVVAANGLETNQTDNGNTTTYTWEETHPMASYLATVNIAKFDERTATGPNGLPIRSYFQSDLSSDVIAEYDSLPDMIAYYSDLIGPYPFEAYGVVVMPESVGVAMENQTLSVFGADMSFEDAISHELAHQWFGDSVTLDSWPDIWLNEGFASYMEWLWLEHTQGKDFFNNYVNMNYQSASAMFPPGSPTPSTLFDGSVYIRGALVLHALRLTVGDEPFFQILRTYYQRYQYSNASTKDFIAVAEDVSGQDLGSFFDAWLYGTTLPPLP
jgi:aminopeptidase N